VIFFLISMLAYLCFRMFPKSSKNLTNL